MTPNGQNERRFPIQGERIRLPLEPGQQYQGFAVREYGWVPWAVAEEAYKVYSRKYGKDQSLETLAARGGFGWSELVWLLRGGTEETENQLPLPFTVPTSEPA